MSFNPDWDIQYLMHISSYKYCVIKKPEPIPGENTPMVREGCTVMEDGKWWYWRLKTPRPYSEWLGDTWSDDYSSDPNRIVTLRLNRGAPGKIPAPQFIARDGNNWPSGNEEVIPDHITDEMLGDLKLAHLQLCEELQEGKPLRK